MTATTLPIACATGRYLFRTAVNKARDDGKSEAVAYGRAWAALERAGWVEGPDKVWKRASGPESAAAGPLKATLYICRPLLNAQEVVEWAKAQGFTATLAPEDMHATIAFSRQPVQWSAVGRARGKLVVEGGERTVQPLGDKGAVVLKFQSTDLTERWQEILGHGASWDYESYQPHVTITYQAGEMDLGAVLEYDGPLVFGPERLAELDLEWDQKLVEKAANDTRLADLAARLDALLAKGYNPSQPRDRLGRFSGMVGGFGGTVAAEGLNAPQLGTKDPFLITDPTMPSPVEFNDNPEDVAVYVSGFDPGEGLNGVEFAEWKDAPTTDAGWASVEGQKLDLDEPPMPNLKGKRPGSGVVIEEPDGRVWAIEPTNHFGGYEHMMPKGGAEPGLSLQANAIKETFEEAGLKVEITGYLGDFERTTSVARYYTARRVGGSPAKHAEESQSVKLIPKAELAAHLNHPADAPLVAAYLGQPQGVVKARQAGARLDTRFEKAKGGWKKQVRAPSGSPIGGQWVAYGSGGLGAAVAAMGVDLKLQMPDGANLAHPSLKKAQAQTSLFQAKANEGDVAFFSDLDASGKAPKPAKQTYAQKTHQNYVEAKAYAQAKADGATGLKRTPPTASNPKPKPTPAGAAAGEPDVKLSTLTYDSPKPGGSADGAVYKDADGQKWLVKGYPSDDQARQEVLAAGLYKAAGADAPEMKLVATEGKHGKAGVGVMSKWEDGTMPLNPNSATAHYARRDFAADAWLANWDTVGASYDNIRLKSTDDGIKAIRVDPGGSLDYRAMGKTKGAAFDAKATEWTTMRDSGVNPQSAAVFGKMGDADLKASAMKVAAVDDATIKALVAKNLPEPAATKMADKLIARRDAIAKQAGLDMDHAMAPSKLAEGGTNKLAAAADSPAGGKLPDPPVYSGEGSSAFYTKHSAKIVAAVEAGDMKTAETLASYKPKSAAHKQSDNFIAFQAHAQQTLAAAAAKADAVPAHMGPKSKPVTGDLSPAKVGPAPAKTVVTSTANVGQQKKFDAIHDLGEKGDVDGIMSLSFGTNTYGKQQAQKANEWLVHHGYEAKAFPGMNGKNDPNGGLHSITGTVKGATPKPTTSAAATLKAKGGNPSPPAFKPEQISKAPDFENMKGAGQGLSSVAAVNIENNKAAKLIEAQAKQGDITALKNMTFPEVDKDASTKAGSTVYTGKQLPISQHPSQHVKAYHQDVLNEVDFQLNPPRLPDIGQVISGTQFDATKDLIPVPSGKAIAAVPKAQKAGYYIVLGKVEAPIPKIKENNSIVDSAQWRESAKAQWAATPKSTKDATSSYVGAGSGSLNAALQKGGTLSPSHKAKVSAMRKGLVDIPEGTTFVRNMGTSGYNKQSSPEVIKKLQQQLLSAEVGTVYQEPAFTSASWSGGNKVLSNNDIQWQFTAAKGTKAMPGWTTFNSGEGEAIFPPNQRYLIRGAKKVGKTVVVDAILLPDLEG